MTETCPAACQGSVPVLFSLRGAQVGRCSKCGVYVLSGTEASIATEDLDRSQFEGALHTLRHANYARVLKVMDRLRALPGTRLLDVGCSTGWFLRVAAKGGLRAYGIEPDDFFYQRLVANLPAGVEVAKGFFPADLPPTWSDFDWITFHDVFEHLPNPSGVLQAVRERLRPSGFVLLSLPSADGFVFHLSRMLYRCGVKGPLERVFQVHYPFPHLFFFAPRSISALARHAGLEVVLIKRLQSFSGAGATQRARMSRPKNLGDRLRSYANAAALVAFAIAERFLPPDSILVVLRSGGQSSKAR